MASSRSQGRLVAASTITFFFASVSSYASLALALLTVPTPSIYISSSALTLLDDSCSPPPLVDANASISSKNIVLGP